MAMTKKDFIALADTIRYSAHPFDKEHIMELARFCQSQNPQFNRERWLSYIRGECGSNGGSVKPSKM